MKKFYFLILSVLVTLPIVAQQTITGTVTSSEDGLPVIGVSVVVKGTTSGASTNLDGVYSLSASKGQTLVFTYVGMKSQEVKISDSNIIDVVLESTAEQLEEIVVTAMGIKQEKKRMNFAVQSVNSDALTENKSPNFVNALQGKVAGLSVTNSSGSPNAGSQVVIRGISSVNAAQSNEPLFVLDGIPLSGKGSAAADINPNDIENVTVLKGAAAAALYGQDAGNGVIMITTKRGQIGKVVATLNASWQYDKPTRLQQLQTSYSPGSQGFYKEKTMGGWGPLLNKDETVYDNVKNFLNDGFYQKYDLSLSGGSEKFQAYASANYSRSNGIVPNDYLNKFGLLLKATYQPIKSLSFNASVNVIEDRYRSFGSTGMSSVYRWPINDDITEYELDNGFPRFLYYNDVNKFDSPMSPLYSRLKDDGLNKKSRNILNGSIEWRPIKNLSISGRLSYDSRTSSYDGYSVPRWDDSEVYPKMVSPAPPVGDATPEELEQYQKDLEAYYAVLEAYRASPYLSESDIENMSASLLGAYSATSGRNEQFSAQALATYKLELPREFSVDFLLGSEVRVENGLSSSINGYDFNIPGIYSLRNTNPAYLTMDGLEVTHRDKRMFGHFGEIRGDYKGLASLSITGRFDWSSSLLTSPYFYPSITGGLLFSEMFNLSGKVFSYGKLRGNYAVVGKDTNNLYLFDRKYKQFPMYPDGGYGLDPTMSSADINLMPEMISTWEIGTDLRFFDNRTRLDIAYYATLVDRQIVTVRVSNTSGHILQTRNEGSIRNEGVEFTLEQDIIKNRDFSWVAGLNFGLNRGKVTSLPEEVAEIAGPQYGDIFPSAFLGHSTTSLSGKDYERTEDGTIICGTDGYPKIDPNKNKYIGNREPLFRAGFTNSFRYKDFSLSFLFDGRVGGDVVNVTGRGLISNGQSKMLETYRGRQIVIDGVVLQEDGSYMANTTPITLDHETITNYYHAVSSNFIEDGSYLRLSYLTLGYDISKYVKKIGLSGLRFSLTGNNLFLLTKYTGADPTLNANTSAGGTGAAGIDNYAVPNTMSVNFGVTLSF